MLSPTPYQREIANAVARDLLSERGSAFTVEMPLGAGVSELASQLEMLVMSINVNVGGTLLRVTPAEPASVKERLTAYLREGALKGLWSAERSDVVRLGCAQVRYVAPKNLDGLSEKFDLVQVIDAHLLSQEELDRVLALVETSGATAVLYGRPWSGATPFEQFKVVNKQAQTLDGHVRHFRVTLERAEDELPGYAERVASVRASLGEGHPAFETAYRLRPVAEGASAFSEERLWALFAGGAPRKVAGGGFLSASVVLTRLPERGDGALVPASSATAVVTIGEQTADGLRVIDHRWIEADSTLSLTRAIERFVGKTRPCSSIFVRPLTEQPSGEVRYLLERSLGARRVRWTSGAADLREQEASALMEGVLNDRVRLYAMDGSPEYKMLREEMSRASLRLGQGRGVAIAVEGSTEGFLEGLSILTHDGAKSAGERTAALPAAIAS